MPSFLSQNSVFKDTLTIVLAGGQGERLYPLTKERAKPAVSFAGNFRLIDFTLSNCVNSGIRRIYVLTQYMSSTLERHIREGWSIFCRELGEFIQTVPPQQRMTSRWYEGTADAVLHNIHILQEEAPERVLILSGDHLYKMNYAEMLRFHLEKRAHLTVAGMRVGTEEAKRFGVFEINEEGRVISFEEKPSRPRTLPHDTSKSLASMGVYIFETKKLVRALIEDAKKNTAHDFGRNILPWMLTRGDRVYCYSFLKENSRQPGYWRDIGTLDSYWQTSMELLSSFPTFNLYETHWPIRTYQEQSPPARIVSADEGENPDQFISNSLISPGCIIDRARVEKSIFSPRVYAGQSSRVEKSVLMKKVKVGKRARVRNAIIDEEVVIPEDYRIGYNQEEDAAKFIVSSKGIVVVPRGMHLD